MLVLEDELKEKVEKNLSKFSKVLKNCLKAKEEEILVVSDYGEGKNKLAAMMGYGYYQATEEKGFKANILIQEVKKGFMQADWGVIKALKQLERNSIVINCLSNKMGRLGELGNSFRAFCRKNQHRFISATGLGGVNFNKFDLFMEAMDVNYSRMAKKGLWLKNKLDRAKEIRIKTEKGTDIAFKVEGMKAVANVGDYREAGTGGNIPAGEVYIPPKGFEGVEGKVVIDGSMRGDEGTILLKEAMELAVEKGRVVKIEGAAKDWLEKNLTKYENWAKYPERVRMIGELGIGINPGAVLIGSSILDEKVLGTAHIAIGSNYWFGGAIRTVLHLDHVFLKPRIYIDGEELKV